MKESSIEIVKIKVSALGGLLAYFASLNFEIFFIWIILTIIDIITGVIKGLKNGDFSSREMKIGLLKKVGEFMLLLALALGQRVAALNGLNVPVTNIFIAIWCFKELGSIIENAIEMNIKIPDTIMKWFKVVNQQINKDEDENK